MSDDAWLREAAACTNRTSFSCCLCDTDVCNNHRHFVRKSDTGIDVYVCNYCYQTCMEAHNNKIKDRTMSEMDKDILAKIRENVTKDIEQSLYLIDDGGYCGAQALEILKKEKEE